MVLRSIVRVPRHTQNLAVHQGNQNMANVAKPSMEPDISFSRKDNHIAMFFCLLRGPLIKSFWGWSRLKSVMIERKVAIDISINASTIANDLNRQGISSCKCHQHKTICIGFGSQGSLAHVRHLNVSARWQGPQVLPWVKRVNIASNSLDGFEVFYSGKTSCQTAPKRRWNEEHVFGHHLDDHLLMC